MSSTTRVKIAFLVAVLALGAVTAGAVALRGDDEEVSTRVSNAAEYRPSIPEHGGRERGEEERQDRRAAPAPAPPSEPVPTEVVAPSPDHAAVVDPDEISERPADGGYEPEPEPELEDESESGSGGSEDGEVETDTESGDEHEAE